MAYLQDIYNIINKKHDNKGIEIDEIPDNMKHRYKLTTPIIVLEKGKIFNAEKNEDDISLNVNNYKDINNRFWQIIKNIGWCHVSDGIVSYNNVKRAVNAVQLNVVSKNLETYIRVLFNKIMMYPACINVYVGDDEWLSILAHIVLMGFDLYNAIYDDQSGSLLEFIITQKEYQTNSLTKMLDIKINL